MVPRYSRPEMTAIWSEENKYQIWFDIEFAAMEAMSELCLVPKQAVEDVKNKAKWTIERTLEIENTTKHDVIAFLTNISENAGESAKYMHLGMTSSDVLDTCLSLQIKQSSDLLLKGIDAVLNSLKKRAFEFKDSVCIGRSHGIHAEPTTIGLKFAGFYAEFLRAKKRLEFAKADISVCAISGAVGTFANVDPYVQEYVSKKLGLDEETISTQVIPRDRHAQFFATLGVIASSIERIAVEIRHMQRTEVLEAEEAFAKGQKGSSAMPHKRNPVLTENITGLARIVRAFVLPTMENVALWHERDISHSSVERFAGPDACITLDFALNRLAGVVENLQVYPHNALKNMNKLKGLIFSQRVMLACVSDLKMTREDAYSAVQKEAMKIWQEETSLTFQELIIQAKLGFSLDKISELFDLTYHTKNVDFIFNKVFKD